MEIRKSHGFSRYQLLETRLNRLILRKRRKRIIVKLLPEARSVMGSRFLEHNDIRGQQLTDSKAIVLLRLPVLADGSPAHNWHTGLVRQRGFPAHFPEARFWPTG